jgi:hypothetical protein
VTFSRNLIAPSFLVPTLVLGLGLGLAACGPSMTGADDDLVGDDDDDDDGPSCASPSPEGSAASCADGRDNDCDGNPDCSDPDCSGVGECPVCGRVDTSAGNGIPLPDGITIGDSCSSDAECTAGAPNCVEAECHASYVSTLDVIGFGDNQMFQSPALIKSVCANMEHSWLRDMEIRLRSPGGQIVRLQKFLGRTGGEIYLGQANDCDEDGSPVAGQGAMYCWKPTAANPPMLDYANNGGAMLDVDSCDGFGFPVEELPPGDYKAADPWENFVGSPLNGQWSIIVTDLWGIDNGFIFDWTIEFDPNSIEDCSGPIIGRTLSGTPGHMVFTSPADAAGAIQ